MRDHARLSPDEWDRIAETRARHEGVPGIAREVGRGKSTVSRELRRNGRRGRYGACTARGRRPRSRVARRRGFEARACEAVGEAGVAALRGRPLETVAPGRGKEFANHAEVVSEALGGVRFYFCRRTPHLAEADG